MIRLATPKTRTTDTVALVALSDDAVDRAAVEAMTDDERAEIIAYQRGETHDASVLPRLPGVVASEFIVRPLNQRELLVVQADAEGNVGASSYGYVRMGLQEIRGCGWKPKRSSWHGTQALTLASVEDLPSDLVLFLSSHIWRISELSPLPEPK